MRPARRKKGSHRSKTLLLVFVVVAIALLLLRMWVFVHGRR